MNSTLELGSARESTGRVMVHCLALKKWADTTGSDEIIPQPTAAELNSIYIDMR